VTRESSCNTNLVFLIFPQNYGSLFFLETLLPLVHYLQAEQSFVNLPGKLSMVTGYCLKFHTRNLENDFKNSFHSSLCNPLQLF
jgi:hypothetical protein